MKTETENYFFSEITDVEIGADSGNLKKAIVFEHYFEDKKIAITLDNDLLLALSEIKEILPY